MSERSTVPTAPDLLATVEKLRPILEKNGPIAEQERRLPTEVYEAMLAAGLYRMPVPKAYGGLEQHPIQTYAVLEALARIETSAAWNLVVGCCALCYLPFMPAAAGDEIYGSGPDVVFAGASAPPVTARRTKGGWRLNGRVPFASGANRADWFFLSAVQMEDDRPLINPDTRQPIAMVTYAPGSAVRIVDTWHGSGLRGTGSNDFVLEDVFVPDYRTAVVAPLREPPLAFTGPLYRVAVWQIVQCEAVVSLGAAEAAIDKLVALAQVKTPVRSPSLLRERSMAQHHVARARALVDAAREYLYASMSEAYGAAETGNEIAETTKVRLQLAACFAAEACTQAVDLVHEAASTSAIRVEQGIERHFRDLHTLSQHGDKSYMRYESVGKLLYGLPTDWFVLTL